MIERAAREVVLAAGAIGSPQLLMLSGIGPSAHLRCVGVDVVADLPGIGSNLQDHVITGVAPEKVAVELLNAFDNIRYRWDHTDDWAPRELGIVTHPEPVRVHPFTDGNGRATRLLADLVFITAQDPAEFQYDWDVDKERYVDREPLHQVCSCAVNLRRPSLVSGVEFDGQGGRPA